MSSAPGATGPEAWVFHAGALGDFILVWPLLRALGRRYRRVHVVADSEKALIAAAYLEPTGAAVPEDVQNRAFTRLWAGEAIASHPAAALVVNMVADPAAAGAARWMEGAARMFPSARLAYVGPVGSPSRHAAWSEFSVAELGTVRPRANPRAPVVCHVGAGSEVKRWPMDLWRPLIETLRVEGTDVTVIAGEVESERMSDAERALFRALSGRTCGSLRELAEITAGARAFIGADTGPTHLAAQLGIPTLALFGPTDAATWAPVGPIVEVMAPASPCAVTWITPGVVAGRLARFLRAV